MKALDNLSVGKGEKPFIKSFPTLIQSERHSPRGHDFALWIHEKWPTCNLLISYKIVLSKKPIKLLPHSKWS